MYEYLRGTLTHCTAQKATLEVGGIGYSLYITLATFEKLSSLGSEVQLFTSVVIREDSHKIFGFLTREERDCFETLNEISGIGPRLSIALLGHLTLEELFDAVEQANAKAISKVPGIGKKMAERLILELRDKLGNISLTSTPAQGSTRDAISALIHLGYNALEAQKAVKKVLANQEKEPPLSELISLALKTKKS